jgi:hypothetical protein
LFDEAWRKWILAVRRQIGTIDLADLIYVRSQYYVDRQAQEMRLHDVAPEPPDPEKPVLFGDKEGRIALANRHKDPLYLFAALQRQLGYPIVPRRKPVDDVPQLLPQILRRLEQMDLRLKLLEEEQRGGFDLTKFYERPQHPAGPAGPTPE